MGWPFGSLEEFLDSLPEVSRRLEGCGTGRRACTGPVGRRRERRRGRGPGRRGEAPGGEEEEPKE